MQLYSGTHFGKYCNLIEIQIVRYSTPKDCRMGCLTKERMMCKL